VQNRCRTSLDGLAGAFLQGLRHVFDQQHHDPVVVLIEQRVRDHDAIARGDAVVSIGPEFHAHLPAQWFITITT